MDNLWARNRATSFYHGYRLIGLLVVAVCFKFTYRLPMTRGTVSAPWFVQLHGVALLAWLLLFIGRVGLLKTGRTIFKPPASLERLLQMQS